ncbi:MAG TPA: BCCT family transporter [Halococcus sp.]|nr:BCCT family transporter [Halococcus sp.]
MSQSSGREWLAEFREEIDPPVFWVGVLVSAAFIVAYALAPNKAGTDQNYVGWAMSAINDWLWTNLAWYYLIAMFVFVAFSVFLILGPWGNIKIGGDDAEPRHSFFAFFAMFFSAGIAAGIDFWGPAEPIYHFGYGTPITGPGASTGQLMVDSLVYSFFHWGISAWCAYLIVAVPVGYFAYNKGAPFRFSTLLAPFIGIDNLEDSNWAKVVDIIAVFATLGGVATSLGLIGQQLVTGIEYVFPQVGQISSLWTFLIIAGITVLFTASVVSGVDKGIKWISQVNVGLFFVIAVATFLIGFPFFVLNIGTTAFGTYINQFFHLSFLTGAGVERTLSGVAGEGLTVTGFLGSWTIFYWAWWFSWAPFAGIFLARLSKGRTIREIAFTGVIATTLATIPWFAILGATSMKLQATGAADILGPVAQYGEAVSGYALFGALPGGAFWMALFFILVITFFVTSADSSTLSVAMLTSGGKEQPSGANRLMWGVIQGVIAGILVILGGTLALQQAAIITGAPVAIVGLLGIWGLIKEFSSEYGRVLVQEGAAVRGDDSLISGIGEGGESSGSSTTEDD